MENITLTQYSLKEKYLKVEPEGRIRRYQFFVRTLVPGILIGLFYVFGITALVPLLLGAFGIAGFAALVYITLVGAVLLNIINFITAYFISVPLAKKRSHDFGSDGKWSELIIKIFLGAQVISMIISMASLSGVEIPGINVLTQVTSIISIIYFILIIVLLFRPGNKGDNQFGKDPINTKVSFLG